MEDSGLNVIKKSLNIIKNEFIQKCFFGVEFFIEFTQLKLINECIGR